RRCSEVVPGAVDERIAGRERVEGLIQHLA
ncbi:MAG: hypothetical protein ACI9TI_001993, partial [Natronomonas sp.]